MENTIQQKLEEARSLVQRAEGALEAARQSSIEEIIQAAEHALTEASAKVASLEEEAATEAEEAAKAAAEAEEAAKAAAEAEAAAKTAAEAEEAAKAGESEEAKASEEAGEAEAAGDADSVAEDAELIDNILSQDEADQPAQPKKKKTGLVIGICLGVAALLGGGYYYYTNYGMPWTQSPAEAPANLDVVMPDLILTDASDAESALAALGIKTDVLYVPSEKVPAGQVTLQSVSAGQPVTGTVVLYVSMGPAPTPTPDRGPLPTPTPSPTPKPVKTKAPVIELPVETPCPTG